ncbi:citrinin biosynthesis oxidoreductase CtnB [Myriangium duriaei CBS 260.36]|uniref:Citrinin biosynthesis oxidoreductase CtnB n=1 Tax=Myriangium duriaei CBS 260.36 TaxID=1168546 RepID=A0A9P4J0A4_9PEZI|nr:citrinin biosynthesis oxidoreductase CtnB [Myriangium duriaei CBS 260.36]
MFVRSAASTDSTLHLPRILCLHGGGTNAHIFRLQCRVLERTLQSSFRFVYAQAPFPAEPGSDVTSVYMKDGPFTGWLQSDPTDAHRSDDEVIDEIDAALSLAMCADDLRGATGDWVALLGFSQGAKIAASILYAQQVCQERAGKNAIWPRFSFAILFAGRGPLVWLQSGIVMPHGLIDAKQLSTSNYRPAVKKGSDEHVLKLPTIHVHGLNDPGIELHRGLLDRYCDSRSTFLLEWDGDHRMPIQTKDVAAVVEAIYLMAWKTGVLNLHT